MEKKIDYIELYKLQDLVLKCAFSQQNCFFLTGGTALHRFHYHYRYSDDLDFFAPNSNLYFEDLREIADNITAKGLKLSAQLEVKCFHRWLINDFLQVDFVNDSVHRHGKSLLINNFKIDNQMNILTNKLSAIINRDEEKDFFDLFVLCNHLPFCWSEALQIANQKSPITKEFLVERLQTFPLQWLEKLKLINPFTINHESVQQVCNDILSEKENGLLLNREAKETPSSTKKSD
jgi:hypothetical protein